MNIIHPVSEVNINEYIIFLRYLYGHIFVVRYTDADGKRRDKRFSFVRSWGANWSPPSIDIDVIKALRILHDISILGAGPIGGLRLLTRRKTD